MRGLESVRFDDVDLAAWAGDVAAFGVRGLDTRKAAERWFSIPEARARYDLPQHAFTVNAITGAMILCGSMSADFATPELSRIAASAERPGREHAVRLLIEQATPEASAALAKLDLTFLPEKARGMVNQYLTDRPRFKPRAHPKVQRAEFVKAFQATVNGDVLVK